MGHGHFGSAKISLVSVLLVTLSWCVLTPPIAAQAPAALSHEEATELAKLMCSQVSNVGTIASIVQIKAPPGTPAPPPREPFVSDDVYDALVALGPYSLPCLTDAMMDTRWMPDPRSEPLVGAPRVGDVAYMILGDKGVSDVLPSLAGKKQNELGMGDYLLWPSVGNHRKRLQDAVRSWIIAHPDCCGKPPTLRMTAPLTEKSRISGAQLEKLRSQFAKLRLGMSSNAVLSTVGLPQGADDVDSAGHFEIALLGYSARDHNETRAYIYFTERWTNTIAQRDPLRDRYIIVFFSAEDKLTRMFSNVSGIAPMFPRNEALWQRLMWGEPTKP